MKICQYIAKSNAKWAFLAFPIALYATAVFAQRPPQVRPQNYTDEQMQAMIKSSQIAYEGYLSLLKAERASIPPDQKALLDSWDLLRDQTQSALNMFKEFSNKLPDDSVAREKEMDRRLAAIQEQMGFINVTLDRLIKEARRLHGWASFGGTDAQVAALKKLLDGEFDQRTRIVKPGAVQIQSSVMTQMMNVQALMNGTLIPPKPMPVPPAKPPVKPPVKPEPMPEPEEEPPRKPFASSKPEEPEPVEAEPMLVAMPMPKTEREARATLAALNEIIKELEKQKKQFEDDLMKKSKK